MTSPIDSTPESRMWASLAHISAFAGLVFPFGSVLGPLLIWLVKREEMPFVDDQGKEALNFNISMTLYMVVSILMIVVLVGFLMIGVLALIWAVLVILAAVRSNEGIPYRYPLTIRFIQ
ncbi:DUF4870 domain-containing protein [Phormidium sp. FACHB-1136]|jgi:uncharacterized Tic20 family protein|uniref:DUF4870 domain-containing protein n=1 Tax=Phormidium sp. FACHB-1136 TaxID=2692848 RepID=UPI001682D4EF|nr:DUF4870 domain-containing protein [Phormidium sp. FACHB-1136]MBD2428075.1 DUF4870 domain-containing protein [Phormidium sp. FACHB-1136]